jgi:8-oxo-dGTP pyrophosphatase MutT (NUDIX family)
VRDGEDWLAAARRELREELDMTVASVGAVVFSAVDPASRFRIHFVEVDGRGTPRAKEHAEVGWFTPGELEALPMAPADAEMVTRLRA